MGPEASLSLWHTPRDSLRANAKACTCVSQAKGLADGLEQGQRSSRHHMSILYLDRLLISTTVAKRILNTGRLGSRRSAGHHRWWHGWLHPNHTATPAALRCNARACRPQRRNIKVRIQKGNVRAVKRRRLNQVCQPVEHSQFNIHHLTVHTKIQQREKKKKRCMIWMDARGRRVSADISGRTKDFFVLDRLLTYCSCFSA